MTDLILSGLGFAQARPNVMTKSQDVKNEVTDGILAFAG